MTTFFFFLSDWEMKRENNNGLWMFSEVAYIELRENRPWGKIWASEKQNHIPIILLKFNSRWWHSDVKDGSAKSHRELQQNLIPHREHAQDPTLVGWELMENQCEGHQSEILFSKGQRLLRTGLSIQVSTRCRIHCTLWRPISDNSSLEVATEFSSTSNCTNGEPRFSSPTLYLENIDKNFF